MVSDKSEVDCDKSSLITAFILELDVTLLYKSGVKYIFVH